MGMPMSPYANRMADPDQEGFATDKVPAMPVQDFAVDGESTPASSIGETAGHFAELANEFDGMSDLLDEAAEEFHRLAVDHKKGTGHDFLGGHGGGGSAGGPGGTAAGASSPPARRRGRARRGARFAWRRRPPRPE